MNRNFAVPAGQCRRALLGMREFEKLGAVPLGKGAQ